MVRICATVTVAMICELAHAGWRVALLAVFVPLLRWLTPAVFLLLFVTA